MVLFCFVFLVFKECSYPLFFHKSQGNFAVEMCFISKIVIKMFLIYIANKLRSQSRVSSL